MYSLQNICTIQGVLLRHGAQSFDHLVKKFSFLYENRKFVSVYTTARHQMTADHSHVIISLR